MTRPSLAKGGGFDRQEAATGIAIRIKGTLR
jgi:hypothetical protein